MENINLSSSPRLSCASKEQWNKFLSRFLLAVGVAFTTAGIVFFFAYNWSDLPKFAKIGMVEILLVISVSLVLLTSWSKLVKQIILTGSAFLIGTLFAVFGQVYQTGADTYDLFLVWTLFTLLWAIASRFAPLWLVFVGLLCTTLWLYAIQITTYDDWLITPINSLITWICAITTFIAEWIYSKNKPGKQNLWFIQTMAIACVFHTSYLLIIGIMDEQDSVILPLITTLLLFVSGIWFGLQQKRLFYIATIPFASLVILLCLIARHIKMEVGGLFLLTLIAIIGTTLLIYVVSQLKKTWYDTAEK